MLNAEQLAVINDPTPHKLVAAGPGTGKTFTLVELIAAYVEAGGVEPSNLLAITFTRKAAAELRERIRARIGHEGDTGPFVSTFHALAYTLLQEQIHVLMDEHGAPLYHPGVTLMGPEDRDAWLQDIAAEQDVTKDKTKVMQAALEYLKPCAEKPEVFESRVSSAAWTLASTYRLRLRASNALDLDMLLPMIGDLLTQHPRIAEHYRGRWPYCVVDEYQDTSPEQQRLIDLLAPKRLTVVGDIDQSIFAWRGAHPQGFLDFGLRPEVITLRLQQNYRSVPDVVTAANRLIANNANRIDMRIVPVRSAEDCSAAVRMTHFLTGTAEVESVCDGIASGLATHPPKDMAILARTNGMLEPFAAALREREIPILLAQNRASRWDRPDMRWLVALLRFASNPEHDASLLHLLQRPVPLLTEREILDVRLKQAELRRLSGERVTLASTILAVCPTSMATALIRAVAAVRADEARDEREVPDFAEAAVAACLKVVNIGDPAAVLQQIREWAAEERERVNTAAFLAWYAYRDMADSLPSREKVNAVTLATIHTAKGLEWPIVFLVGMEEGRFPASWAGKDEAAVAQERNVAYVAVTRARDLLFVSSSQQPISRNPKPHEPSRFMMEMTQSEV